MASPIVHDCRYLLNGLTFCQTHIYTHGLFIRRLWSIAPALMDLCRPDLELGVM